MIAESSKLMERKYFEGKILIKEFQLNFAYKGFYYLFVGVCHIIQTSISKKFGSYSVFQVKDQCDVL